MSRVIDVKLWGVVVGQLGYEPGQTEVATFEYTEAFANSGIQVAPLQMKAPTRIHSFADISHRTFKGLPGIIADSLPDKFGHQLIDIFMAQKRVAPEQITALDRLLYIGARGMGALEYHPAEQIKDDSEGLALDVHTLAQIAAQVISTNSAKHAQLMDATNRAQALKLIRVGSSAGGARSKALVASAPDGTIKDGTVNHGIDHRYWLLKFDSENNQDRDGTDPKGMTRVEFVYGMLARECGIDMPQTSQIIDGDDFHFLIERFDRVVENGRVEKLHYASWCGINHAHRDISGAYSYEQLAMVIRQMGLGQSALTEIFRRAVFNIVGRNQDDHTKNFGFLMNKSGQWRLAPAFDVTYAYDPTGLWTSTHQIRLAGKQTDFTRQDLLAFGEYCNLKKRKAEGIIDTTLSVFEQFKPKAQAVGVDELLLETVCGSLRFYLGG